MKTYRKAYIDTGRPITDLLNQYGVKTFKETNDGLLAIHKKINGDWFWLYFRFNGERLMLSGSTRRFEK